MCCASRVTIKYLYTEYSDSNATGNIDITYSALLIFFLLIFYDIKKKKKKKYWYSSKISMRAQSASWLDNRATLLRGSWMLYLR